ncbi:CotH protein [Candidatus Izimaplasma bacterium HR1]|jgi:spore coat protein CotH|uniref:CotH kinase family protein n=1 Tax=Candidatus Izimoplasma sp. HR1 TaxID=1541959 RepID=UPI0004F7EA75|nr:CotH protein [Candidatus Izimaplasma bacterium HR1]
MINLVLRRVLIIATLVTVLFGLDSLSDESLLLNLPSELEIIDVLAQQRAQKEEILKAQVDYIAAQEKMVEYYQEQIIKQEEFILIENARQEEDRIKAIEEAMENNYTLGDRDKPLDYQNLFDDSIKHTFVLDFDRSEWQHLLDSMNEYHDMFGNYKSNEYVKADVSYYGDEELIFIPDVGIRSKGNNYSRRLPENSEGVVVPIHYVMKFNETFDTTFGTTEYDWLKTREVFDLEKLAFKWNRNNDQTYINELYSHRLFQEAGVAMPNITLTKLIIRINGEVEMTELYTAQEVIDEEFIRKHLQDTPTKEVGDLYKVIWPGTLQPITNLYSVGIRDWKSNYRPTYGKETNQDSSDYSSLINFTRNLDNYSGLTLKNYLEDNFDVDMFIRSLAVNVLLGNPDDYRGNANNYYLYFDESDYLTFIPFDYDHSMGVGWSGSPVFIDYTLGNDIYEWEGSGFSSYSDYTPLVDKILEFEEYQILYEDYLEQFINDGYFSFNYYSDLFNTLESAYGNEFDMSNDKFYYINAKTNAVLEDIIYYRNQRD